MTSSTSPDELKAMSTSYEDYDATSQIYDNYRVPVGLDVLRRALQDNAASQGMEVKDVSLLDAGCGSGNYLNLLKTEVGQAKGLEVNDGMLAQARKKGLDVTHGSITDLPFDKESFHAALTTQVLHHLVVRDWDVAEKDQANLRDPSAKFAQVKKACQEVFRVLKPGGIWMINVCTPEQVLDGVWWVPVIPAAMEKIASLLAPPKLFKDFLLEAGFEASVESHILHDYPLQENFYKDVKGPFSKQWRDATSCWALATDSELEQGLEWLRKKLDAGEGDKLIKDKEDVLKHLGLTTTFIARKPL